MSKRQYSKADWPEIRQRYITSNIGLRRLADECGVSFYTVAARCKREGWHSQRKRSAALAQAGLREELDKTATESGRELGMTVNAFLQRTLVEGKHFLNLIQKLMEEGDLDGAKLQKFVRAWREINEVLRQVFNLDIGSGSFGRVIDPTFVRINVLNPSSVTLAASIPEALRPARCIEIDAETGQPTSTDPG